MRGLAIRLALFDLGRPCFRLTGTFGKTSKQVASIELFGKDCVGSVSESVVMSAFESM